MVAPKGIRTCVRTVVVGVKRVWDSVPCQKWVRKQARVRVIIITAMVVMVTVRVLGRRVIILVYMQHISSIELVLWWDTVTWVAVKVLGMRV